MKLRTQFVILIGGIIAVPFLVSAFTLLVQLSILRSMLIFGMIVVGGPEWTSAFGASAVTDEAPFAAASENGHVAEQFLEKGRKLGQRVAELAGDGGWIIAAAGCVEKAARRFQNLVGGGPAQRG